jgi:hypothetical protein
MIKSKVLIKVSLHESGGLEVEINSGETGKMAVIGILEQIKYNLLNSDNEVENLDVKKYDA